MLLQPGKQSKRTCSKKMKRYKFYHCRARPRYQSRYLFTFTTTGSRSFGLHEIFKCSHLKFTVYGHKQASKQASRHTHNFCKCSDTALQPLLLLRFVQFQIASFTHVMNAPRPFAPAYYCERKRKVKTGEAWERGYSRLQLINT